MFTHISAITPGDESDKMAVSVGVTAMVVFLVILSAIVVGVVLIIRARRYPAKPNTSPAIQEDMEQNMCDNPSYSVVYKKEAMDTSLSYENTEVKSEVITILSNIIRCYTVQLLDFF